MKPAYTTTRFDCPTCGSSHFGSSTHNGNTVCYCHGYVQRQPCSFSCPLPDFWKHMTKVTVERFESREEYDAHHQATNGGTVAAQGTRST